MTMAKVKLGDVAIEKRETWTGSTQGVPIVGLEHLIPGEVTLSSWDSDTDNTFSKMFRKDQVLLGRRRVYLRKAVIAPFEGICSGDITVIEAIPGKISSRLLPFVIQNERFFDYAMQGSAGSLSPRVKWEHLKDYEFTLPEYEEQDSLADKLWSALKLKESYQKLLSATDEIVKSRFIEMFGDGKYRNVRLGDYTDLTWGDTNTTKNSYVEEGYLAFSAGGPDGKLDHYDYDREGIVLSAIGADCGKTWFAEGKWSCIKNTIRFWSTSNDLDNYYLFLATKDKDFWPRKGGAQPFIPQGDARNCVIPLPPLTLQRSYIAFAKQADKSKFNGFKSRFIEMFGAPNSNPLGIPTGLVSDIFTLQMGKTPARDTARYWAKDGSGNKWISIADMSQYEYFTEDTEEYISDSAVKETGMKLIPEQTVIMSFKLTIGRVSVTSEPIFSNEAIVAFIPRVHVYNTRFLYYLVKFYDWLENAALAVKGKTLNKESIGKNRLIIPSIESQNEFASFAEQADKSKYLS